MKKVFNNEELNVLMQSLAKLKKRIRLQEEMLAQKRQQIHNDIVYEAKETSVLILFISLTIAILKTVEFDELPIFRIQLCYCVVIGIVIFRYLQAARRKQQIKSETKKLQARQEQEEMQKMQKEKQLAKKQQVEKERKCKENKGEGKEKDKDKVTFSMSIAVDKKKNLNEDSNILIQTKVDSAFLEFDSKLKFKLRSIDVKTLENVINKYGGYSKCYERFLVARNNNSDKALEMFADCVKFRLDKKLDEEKSEEEQKALTERLNRVRPYWTGAICTYTDEDHGKSPVMYFKVSYLDPKFLLNNFTEEEFTEFYVHFMEESLSSQLKGNSKITNYKDWRGMVEIYDLGGLRFSQFHLGGLRLIAKVLSMGQKYYPENLRKAFIINVPRFAAAGWKVLTPVLDQNTQSKVTLSSSNCRDEIAKLVGEKSIRNIHVAPPPNYSAKAKVVPLFM